MIATSEQNAEATRVGRAVLAQVLPWVDPWAPDASLELRSRNLGHGLLVAVLMAARADGLNRIWLIEGLGEAIGHAIFLQPPETQALILADLQRGIDRGLARVAREMTPAGEA